MKEGSPKDKDAEKTNTSNLVESQAMIFFSIHTVHVNGKMVKVTKKEPKGRTGTAEAQSC